jgi:tetratricopeptide (TPR) repeat protein
MANSARIDELRKKFDENPRRYFAPLANEYRKSGDLAQAVFILEEYLPQQTGHISGHIVYGQTLFELGRDEEAKRVFEAALSLDPENLIALRHLGHISRQSGDFDAARSWYQRLLEADPRDAEIEQLLGSLEAAAQAHAAELSRPSQSAPLPPDASAAAEVDDSPLQIEHLVQQESPGAPPRTETHPLPPPLPLSHESAPAIATPAAAMAPPPLPEAEAPEASHEDVAVTEELLDLDDFSFGSLDAAPPAASTHASGSASGDGGRAASEESSTDDDHSTMPPPPAVEASALTSDADESGRSDEGIGFVPFSDLGPQVPESEPEDIDGLETYAFQSPDGPVAEASEDVGSFYLESSYTAPEAGESVDQAEGFESGEMELAAEASAAAETEPQRQTEERVDHAGQTDSFETPDEGDATEVAEANHPTPVASVAGPVASPTPASTATPVRSTPVAATGVVANPTDIGTLTDGESDAFATETMAKLYLSQGHLESALGIYRTLSAKQPEDESLRHQIEEIEDRAQRRRREPTPPTPIEASPMDAPPMDDAEDFAEPAPRAGVPTIRDFLLGIIRRGAPSATSARAPNGGTIDALFDAGDALDDDLVAADTLAQAFAPHPESERDSLVGRPAREASSELSLDRVFRQPTPAHAGEASAGGFSFDQFFAGERTDDSDAGAPGKPGDDDDIEQFNAWLNGLKKT